MTRIAAALFACLFSISAAIAQALQPIPIASVWLPQGRISSISVTTSSAATALPTTGLTAWLCNTGSNDAFLAFGIANTITATVAAGSRLAAGGCGAYPLAPRAGVAYTYVAAIGSGGSTTIYVETGLGNPPTLLGTSAPLPSGAATAANQSSQITQETAINTVTGLTSDAAATAGSTGTLSAKMRLMTSQLAVLATGATPASFIAANSNNAATLKGTPGVVYSVQLAGVGAAPAYLKFYDKASTPTCQSDTVVAQFMIPAASTAANGAGSNISLPVGKNFAAGISYCVVTGIAANDNTSVAAATFIVNIDYK